MRKILFLTIILAGCSTSGVMPQLSQYNINLEPWYSGKAVTSVTFSYPGDVEGDRLPMCLAQSISNRSVSLEDSSRSFYGAYTGNYYSISSAREAPGGNVLSYVGRDARSAVANGSTSYDASALVRRAVRFSLFVDINGGRRVMSFTNLEQAQLSTGVAKNTGFNRIGAWSGANPDLAIASLKSLSEQINNCISR